MATRLTADASSPSYDQWANKELKECSSNVKEITQLCNGITDELRESRLSVKTCSKADNLAGGVFYLMGMMHRLKNWIASNNINSTSLAAHKNFKAQFEAVEEQVKNLKECSFPLIREVKYRVGPEMKILMKSAEEEVGQYLQTRHSDNEDDATFIAECLSSAASFLRVPVKLDNEEIGCIVERDPCAGRIEVLRLLKGWTAYYEYNCDRSYEGIMMRLEALFHPRMKEDERALVLKEEKPRYDSIIGQLHQELGRDEVNYWVWKLANEPSEKDYGSVHRYDDLKILREAILRATKSLADKIMKEEAAGLDPEVVFQKLYEIIGKPQVENPMEWMKENACYFTGQLRHAIKEVKFPGHQFEPIILPSYPWYPSYGTKSEPELIKFDPSFLCAPLAPKFEPEKHQYSKVLEELKALGRQPVLADLKERVEGMINDLSKNGLADTINFEVWKLGGQKSGENWGVVHRYDDAAVLGQALMIAVGRDVGKEVVQKFADEKDRNAFYAEITNIAFGAGNVPTSIDPVAYGKENIALHLHQIPRAEAAVKQKMKGIGDVQ